MKAAVNGVPSFSVLDGWWIEGHLGVTGWAIGDGTDGDMAVEAASLYGKLEDMIVPLFYRNVGRLREGDADVRRPQRVVPQYRAHGPSVHHQRVPASVRSGLAVAAG
jgi:glucan phosphorylase